MTATSNFSKGLSTKDKSFQSIILKLQTFWGEQDCTIMQPYDLEMGAGTFHPATTLRTLGTKPWRTAYVQPCRRPTDGRYGDNPNRVQSYYQFQVIVKPSPDDIQELMLESFRAIGIDPAIHDIRFVEDNWEGPTLGASGLGWEVWCDGQEVLQFTYFQQLGGADCAPVPVELTYGLERCACVVQGVESLFDLDWNGAEGDRKITYRDIFHQNEREFSAFNFDYADVEKLEGEFKAAEKQCQNLLEKGCVLPAYDQALKASHLFNLLDARGVISVLERASYIGRVRDLARGCCEQYLQQQENTAHSSVSKSASVGA